MNKLNAEAIRKITNLNESLSMTLSASEETFKNAFGISKEDGILNIIKMINQAIEEQI